MLYPIFHVENFFTYKVLLTSLTLIILRKYFLIGLTCARIRPQTNIYAHCMYKTANELKRQLISIFHTATDHCLVSSSSFPLLSHTARICKPNAIFSFNLHVCLSPSHTHTLKLSSLLCPSVNLIFPQLTHVSPLSLLLPLFLTPSFSTIYSNI